MKIAVFVKQVEDARSVRIEKGTGKAKTSGEPVMNPADAHAVSDAIDLRESSGGEITAVTFGSAAARDVLMDAMATGADSGIHVKSEDAAKGDSRMTANALADAVRDGGFDIYLAGHSAVDYGAGQVHFQIAEALGVPHVANVISVAAEGETLTIQRDLDGFADELEVQAPVMLVLADRDQAPKRHPSLRGMMQAKRKPVQEVAAPETMTTPLQWSEPTAQRTSADQIILEGEPAEEAAAKLAAWLREHRLVG